MPRHAIKSFGPVLVWALVVAAPFAAASNSAAVSGQALLNALRDDDEPLARTLIDRHTDLNSRDDTGATPLIWAAQRRNADLVARLLRAGVDPNIVAESGVSALQVAIGNRASGTALLLLANRAKASVAREDGETALMTAARTGQLEVMRQLIAHGADVNAHEDKFNQTALMWSAGYPQQMKLLIEHGADIRARTRVWEVKSPIYTGAYEGHPMPWSTDGEYESKKGGQSALFFAVQKDDFESVVTLLDAGANVNDAAADGSTPLLLALYKWDEGTVVDDYFAGASPEPPFKPNLKIANLLLNRGANANVTNAEGFTPLHGAALGLVSHALLKAVEENNNQGVYKPPVGEKLPVDPREGLAIVNRLLNLKADVNAVTRYPTAGSLGAVRISHTPIGSSPLHIAALSTNVELMDALLAHGGDPNLIRKDGYSPLALAVRANDLPMVTTLVAHGADVTRLYNPTELFSDPPEGQTLAVGPLTKRTNQAILHIAAAAGAFRVVAYLAAHGASLDAKNGQGETPLVLADAQERVRYLNEQRVEALAVAQAFGTDRKRVVRDANTSDAISKALKSTLMGSNGKLQSTQTRVSP